jgi:hypothetical protein
MEAFYCTYKTGNKWYNIMLHKIHGLTHSVAKFSFLCADMKPVKPSFQAKFNLSHQFKKNLSARNAIF